MLILELMPEGMSKDGDEQLDYDEEAIDNGAETTELK